MNYFAFKEKANGETQSMES